MEINFDTGRIMKGGGGQPVNRRAAATSVGNDASLAGAEALTRKLNELSLVRPEKVAAAKARLADLTYPPEDLINGIANLLAKRLTE